MFIVAWVAPKTEADLIIRFSIFLAPVKVPSSFEEFAHE